MAIKFSSYSMKQRLLAVSLLVIFFALCIVFRLSYLQIFNHDNYIQKGLTQWLRDLPLIATRGRITDRNGVVLASSYTTYDVYIRPADIENKSEVARVLSKYLDIENEEIISKISNSLYGEIKIKKDIMG